MIKKYLIYSEKSEVITCVVAISCECGHLQDGRGQPLSHFCRPAAALFNSLVVQRQRFG